MKIDELEIGTLVRWALHEHWDCKGLGFVVDTQPSGAKVIWYQDLLHGHSIGGVWYEYEKDFADAGGKIEIV